MDPLSHQDSLLCTTKPLLFQYSFLNSLLMVHLLSHTLSLQIHVGVTTTTTAFSMFRLFLLLFSVRAFFNILWHAMWHSECGNRESSATTSTPASLRPCHLRLSSCLHAPHEAFPSFEVCKSWPGIFEYYSMSSANLQRPI